MIIPQTVSFSGDKLYKMKNEGKVSDKTLSELRSIADKHMCGPLLAVTERIMKAPSGNPHDYASIGTYWWPNPDTPDGLPYIRRDGETTPAALDTITYRAMTKRAIELALAAYYFDSEEYGRAAEKTLYDWHLNPKTYMTPHAEYSQSIPGICLGRGIGIIDISMSSYQVFDAVAILQALGHINQENVSGLKKWYSDFTDWMLTSENALTEDAELNNHGTYFDVHMLAAAKFTDRKALIKKICKTSYERRFRDQIESDGKQPLELARTMAMVYSLSNLMALTFIANMAESEGYGEYCAIDKKYGDNAIKKAVDYLYPYFVDMSTFPYQEMHPEHAVWRMKYMLSWLDERYPGMGYAEKARSIDNFDIGLAIQPIV